MLKTLRRSLSFPSTGHVYRRTGVLRFQSNEASSTSVISPALLERARAIAAEHAILSSRLANKFDADEAKKAGELGAIVSALKEWETAQNSLSELHQLLQDSQIDDELRSLADEEHKATVENLTAISQSLRKSLIPVHPFAHLPCLIEIRPGAGGSEAALFAGDLLRMYQGYSRRHGLRASLLKFDGTDTVGSGSENAVNEAVLEVDGEGAYGLLRCEAGVHRVQRVPATESKGRTHTSAVAVVVLPSFPTNPADQLGESSYDDPSSDYFIDVKDVRIDVMRAKGAGGQHVNTTDSAVRLTHLPTNSVVAIQDSRSQHQNREKAWRLLRSRLAQARREAREEEMAQLRLSTVGLNKTGRGDKIRTYNWGQQRITDHRSGITLHNLDDVLEGGDDLDKVMESVRAWLTEQDVKSLIAEDEASKRSLST